MGQPEKCYLEHTLVKSLIFNLNHFSKHGSLPCSALPGLSCDRVQDMQVSFMEVKEVEKFASSQQKLFMISSKKFIEDAKKTCEVMCLTLLSPTTSDDAERASKAMLKNNIKDAR